MSCVAIITARGGSKRIPRKNIKNFLGKPIIAYSIQAALKANCFEEVMVSTDDLEIAQISKDYGANIPFLRSLDNSDDFATTATVILEVLEKYESIGQKFDFACCIYPTAPFVTATKLMNAFELLKQKNAETVYPITEFSFPIWRSVNVSPEGKVVFNWPENALKRSQDLNKAYHDCGQFYFIDVKKFFKTKKLIGENCFGMVIPGTEVQDIDTYEDWRLAEIKYSFLDNC